MDNNINSALSSLEKRKIGMEENYMDLSQSLEDTPPTVEKYTYTVTHCSIVYNCKILETTLMFRHLWYITQWHTHQLILKNEEELCVLV